MGLLVIDILSRLVIYLFLKWIWLYWYKAFLCQYFMRERYVLSIRAGICLVFFKFVHHLCFFLQINKGVWPWETFEVYQVYYFHTFVLMDYWIVHFCLQMESLIPWFCLVLSCTTASQHIVHNLASESWEVQNANKSE